MGGFGVSKILCGKTIVIPTTFPDVLDRIIDDYTAINLDSFDMIFWNEISYCFLKTLKILKKE